LDQERQLEEEKLQKYIALQEQIQRLEEAKRLAEIESGMHHRIRKTDLICPRPGS